MLISAATPMVGFTSGSVIFQKDCIPVAPSMVAASYRSEEIDCSAARISTVGTAVSFQI